MGLWGLGVQRFLSPLEGWLPWTLAAFACVPALGRALDLHAAETEALLAHRLALGLLPAFLLAWTTAFRRDRRPANALLSLVLPAAALLVLAGRLGRTLITYDLPQNFLPANGGGLGPLLAPTRLLDLVSALVMLSPLMPVIPLLWPRAETRGRGASAAGEPTTAELASPRTSCSCSPRHS